MRAMLIHETGDPDVLRLEQAEISRARRRGGLDGVRAASVNPIDWKYRRGLIPKQLPALLGNDVSGTVERSRANGFAQGDAVFGIARAVATRSSRPPPLPRSRRSPRA